MAYKAIDIFYRKKDGTHYLLHTTHDSPTAYHALMKYEQYLDQDRYYKEECLNVGETIIFNRVFVVPRPARPKEPPKPRGRKKKNGI